MAKKGTSHAGLKATRLALAYNLMSAISARDLNVVQFATNSGIHRPRISEVLNEEKDMKLSRVCELASALGVPPAFLLMTKEDWTALVAAFAHLLPLIDEPKFHKFLQSSLEEISGKDKARDKAKVGLTYAKTVDAYSDSFKNAKGKDQPAITADARRGAGAEDERRRQAIVCLTGIAQARASRPADLAFLTALGALIGANCSTPAGG